MLTFVIGAFMLLGAIVAISLVSSSDNKRPDDPDSIAAAREEELKREKAECL